MLVNPASHVPIYEQIIEQIRGAVAAGVYRPGEMLPSTRALALELTVNPNTVQRAYQELERQGLIATRKGVGAFVTANGEASAQTGAVKAVYARLAQAIETGRAARLTDEHLRMVFERAVGDTTRAKKAGGAAGKSAGGKANAKGAGGAAGKGAAAGAGGREDVGEADREDLEEAEREDGGEADGEDWGEGGEG